MRWAPKIDDTRLPINRPQPRKEWRGESCPDHTARVPDISDEEIERRFQIALAAIQERNFRKRNGLSTNAIASQ